MSGLDAACGLGGWACGLIVGGDEDGAGDGGFGVVEGGVDGGEGSPFCDDDCADESRRGFDFIEQADAIVGDGGDAAGAGLGAVAGLLVALTAYLDDAVVACVCIVDFSDELFGGGFD